jgi:hypothetical protein
MEVEGRPNASGTAQPQQPERLKDQQALLIRRSGRIASGVGQGQTTPLGAEPSDSDEGGDL